MSDSDSGDKKYKDQPPITLQPERLKGQPETLTPIQQFAAAFAMWLGGFIAVAIVSIIAWRLYSSPHLPDPPALTLANGTPNTEAFEAYIKQYREVEEIKNESMRALFEKAITATTLPLLTTLIGFLIGRASKKSSQDD